jgi:ketosteroid isomerase-like protein
MSKNVDVIQGLYASFARGDVPAVLAAFDASIDWNAPASLFGEKGHASGPDDVARFFGELSGYFPELAVRPKEYLDAGDTVVALGHHVGRGAKSSFDANFVHVWRLRDGKATSFHEVADTAPIVASL